MMPLLFSIFANDIIPILLVAAVGFLLARYLRVEVKTVASVSLNGLTPCLVFTALTSSAISAAEFGRMTFFAVCAIVSIGLVAWLIMLPMRLDRALVNGFVLVVMFANVGNYGLPLILFAFGQEALTQATIYFVANLILMYTLGVLIASSGRASLGQSLLNVLKSPIVYAVAAAAIVLVAHITVPVALMRPIELLGNAALPTQILVLGMQLERVKIERPALIGLATVLRLIVAPLLALALAGALGLEGMALRAGLVQAATPAAVIAALLAVEYQAAPTFVTSAVLLSTLISPVTLTLLIAALGVQH